MKWVLGIIIICLLIETNLKKQGMLPLTFGDPSDYDKVEPSDRISLLGVTELAPGKVHELHVHVYVHVHVM